MTSSSLFIFARVPRAAAVAIFCVIVPTLTLAKEEVPVAGNVYKVPNSPSVYVTLKGPGALQLYKEMSAKPRNDACRGDGRRLKWAGNLACSIARDGASAECDFGINVNNGRASPGRPC
jgi:hypothetical protein